VFLNESARYSRDPECISQFSVYLFILRVFSNSHFRPAASRFCVGLLTIAAEAFRDFSSVCKGECVGSKFRDHDSLFPDPYLHRIHNHLYDKRT
jgi:hypothetical protein